jgi:hypothetical protein
MFYVFNELCVRRLKMVFIWVAISRANPTVFIERHYRTAASRALVLPSSHDLGSAWCCGDP